MRKDKTPAWWDRRTVVPWPKFVKDSKIPSGEFIFVEEFGEAVGGQTWADIEKDTPDWIKKDVEENFIKFIGADDETDAIIRPCKCGLIGPFQIFKIPKFMPQPHKKRFCILCPICNHHGPASATESDAILAWNKDWAA